MIARQLPFITLALFALATSANMSASAQTAGEKVDFNRDIRPILSDKCFKCHGPAEAVREAGLRLDNEEGAFAKLESGHVAIVRGKSSGSELYQRITSKDADEKMPPADSGKSLTPKEIELIKRWIDQGAAWQGHWAFITPKRSPLPQVKQDGWAKNSIDRFILARLEEEKLSPTGEANRRTLVRRVTFDLTGLPPTMKEVEAFVNDASPDAYEKLVDRLLKSPRYGEHIARFWLDAARYGDTHGLHLDNFREMWPYRDWVINSFNANMPFDQFTIEQLGGDLLPNATLDQRIASGFNRCNVTTSEGGSIREEVYVRNVIDRVETAGTIYMGLTTGCSVCHNHKFDPITMKDFYQFFAFFNSLDGSPLDGNKKDHAPIAQVPLPGQKERLAEVDRQIAAIDTKLQARVKAAQPDFAKWLAKAEKSAGGKVALPDGMLAHFPLDEGAGDTTTDAVDPKRKGTVKGAPLWDNGKFGKAFRTDGKNYVEIANAPSFDRTQPFSYGAWIKTDGKTTGAPIAKMDDGNAFRGYDLYVVGRKVAMHFIHRWPKDAVKVTSKQDILKPNTWHHVFVTHDGSAKAAGVTLYVDGKSYPVDVNVDGLKGTTVTDKPLRFGRRNPGSPFTGGSIDDVRIFGRKLESVEVATLSGSDPIAPILAITAAKRTPKQQQTLRTYYFNTFDAVHKKLTADKSKLQGQKVGLAKQVATTLIFKETAEPRPAFILKRGQYDQRGEQVGRDTPTFLPPLAKELPRNRLGLAKWLLSPQHPLTARVTVNRLWQQCFGTGIVKTSEDFGSQGEWPSHPALLDWLAVDFREHNWDMKRFMKQMVMSATYRQSSNVTPQLVKKDPTNRLLARGPRYRLDAEMLRDQALALSGLMSVQFGGPSVKPPQPGGIWKAVGYSGSNTVQFKADIGEKIYRRSVYTFWKRTAPPPSMNILDAPSRESCRVRRERTNTPLQALLMMNESQYFESARHLAQRAILAAGNKPEQRAAFIFSRAAARPADKDEQAELLAAYRSFLADYKKDVDGAKKLIAVGNTAPNGMLDPIELAAWTMVANLVLNLDEVISKN